MCVRVCERYNTHVELVTCISVQYLGYDYDKGEPEEVTDALVLENLWRQNENQVVLPIGPSWPRIGCRLNI